MEPSAGGVAACACAPDAYAPACPPCGILGRPFRPIVIMEERVVGAVWHWLWRLLAAAPEANEPGARKAAVCATPHAATSRVRKLMYMVTSF